MRGLRTRTRLILGGAVGLALLVTVLALRPAGPGAGRAGDLVVPQWPPLLETPPGAGEVLLGVIVTDIYAISFPEQRVGVDYAIWTAQPAGDPDGVLPETAFELANGIEDERERIRAVTRGGVRWVLSRGRAVVKKRWTVADYPFDEHTVRLAFVPPENARAVPSPAGSGLDGSVRITGWRPAVFRLREAGAEAPLPSFLWRGGGEASPILAEVRIARSDRGVWLFFRAFSSLLVAVMIALLSLIIKIDEVEVRADLTVGSMFAAVGSHIVVASLLPETGELTLADKLHALGYAVILIAAAVTVACHRLLINGSVVTARRVNAAAARFLPPLTLVLLIYTCATYALSGLEAAW